MSKGEQGGNENKGGEGMCTASREQGRKLNRVREREKYKKGDGRESRSKRIFKNERI